MEWGSALFTVAQQPTHLAEVVWLPLTTGKMVREISFGAGMCGWRIIIPMPREPKRCWHRRRSGSWNWYRPVLLTVLLPLLWWIGIWAHTRQLSTPFRKICWQCPATMAFTFRRGVKTHSQVAIRRRNYPLSISLRSVRTLHPSISWTGINRMVFMRWSPNPLEAGRFHCKQLTGIRLPLLEMGGINGVRTTLFLYGALPRLFMIHVLPAGGFLRKASLLFW